MIWVISQFELTAAFTVGAILIAIGVIGGTI